MVGMYRNMFGMYFDMFGMLSAPPCFRCIVDSDKDGKINKAQFCNAMTLIRQAQKEGGSMSPAVSLSVCVFTESLAIVSLPLTAWWYHIHVSFLVNSTRWNGIQTNVLSTSDRIWLHPFFWCGVWCIIECCQ